MKQYITTEQSNELSDKGRERLRKWWKPQLDHRVSSQDFEDGTLLYVLVDNDMRSGWSFESAMEDLIVLPLLSIGQMIEFLGQDLDSIKNGINSWSLDRDINGAIYDWKTSEELCDALWEAVKEVLEKE